MGAKSPDAYRTISEAGEETDLPSHVLRFWEGKFSQLKPMKRAGGRRFYRPQDIALLKGLKFLLYEQGYTIKGAQKYLKEHGVAHVAGLADGDQAPVIAAASQDVTPQTEAESQAVSEEVEAPASEPSANFDLFGNVVGSPRQAASSKDKKRLKKVYDKLASARDQLNAVLQA